MVTKSRLSGMVIETGQDERDLGRWCWMKIGTQNRSTYVATVCIPCDSVNKNSTGKRVVDQHRRVLEAAGELRKPDEYFQKDMVK